MSRVEINAGGRQIVVDHDGELAHLADTARQLWDHTHGADDRHGPAIGFQTSQRYTPPVGDNNGGGAYRHRPFAPVNASTEGTTDA